MTSGEPIRGIEARYKLYGLDDRARSRIKQLWPTVAPRLDEAVDAILEASTNLPRVSDITTRHKNLIKTLEVAHLKALLNGDLGVDYFASCRKTVEQEATLGLDARFRSTAGNYLLLAAFKALASKHRFSPARLAESAALVSQIIAFDVANAISLHREAAEAAAGCGARRSMRRLRISPAPSAMCFPPSRMHPRR